MKNRSQSAFEKDVPPVSEDQIILGALKSPTTMVRLGD